MCPSSIRGVWQPIAHVLLAAGSALLLLAVPSPTAHAVGCAPQGPALDSASTELGNGDMLWIGSDGTVGVTTPAGTGTVAIPNAGPHPLQAMVIDAQQDGRRQLIVSTGRVAHLFAVFACDITPMIGPDGQPFLFDMENLRGNGTGVGCVDFGDGRSLAGLQALPNGSGWLVRRTEINLDGTAATIGRSDTVSADSAQNPIVTSAWTVSCGELTLTKDGVQQP